MKSDYLFVALAVAFGSQTLNAQQPAARGPGEVTGLVVAEGTQQALPGATVGVRRMADSTVVATATTNAQGRFSATGLAPGQYRVEISSVGYAAANRPGVAITAQALRADLGTIGLSMAAVTLQEVTVQGQQSQLQVATDRSLYRVADMPLARGSGAIDALRTIPELQVDIDDNITARGGSPLIYLDGRPLPMDGAARLAFLRSLQSDRIERIEYIPNPSARFEAEGQSGIVNIVLRRDVGLGLSGTVSANAGTRGTQSFSNRTNYQKGRLTWFGGANVGFNQTRSNIFEVRQNLLATPRTALQQDATRARDGINGGLDVTTELKLTERSTAWTILRGNWGGAAEDVSTEYIHMDAQDSATERYDRESEMDFGNDSYNGAIGFRRVIQPQRNEFSTEIRYTLGTNFTDDDQSRYLRSLDGPRLGTSPEVSDLAVDWLDGFLSGQADLSKPLFTNVRADIGYRGSMRTVRNEQVYSIFAAGSGAPSLQGDEFFRYREYGHASYLTLDGRFGAVGLQGGLRAEYVDWTAEANPGSQTYASDRFDIFPSFNVSYAAGGGKQFRLGFAERIQRPTATYLNPIDTAPIDPLNQNVGNPDLAPTNYWELSTNFSWTGEVGTVQLNGFRAKGHDLTDRVRTVDALGRSTFVFRNMRDANVWGGNASLNVRQMGIFSGLVSASVQRIQFSELENPDAMKSGVMFNVNGNLTTQLRPTTRVQTSFGYSPSSVMPQGRRLSAKQFNMAIAQNLMNNRVLLNLSIVDPLNLSRVTTLTGDSTYSQTGRSSNRIRRATATVTYSFGRAPQSTRRVVPEQSTEPAPLTN